MIEKKKIDSFEIKAKMMKQETKETENNLTTTLV